MDAAVLDAPAREPVDLDVVRGLETRGAELVGVLNAAVAGLVAVISDALVCEAWQGHGINSPEHWVALRFGMSRHRAARLVAAARALSVLPVCRGAFAAGEIGEDHVAAIVTAQVPPRDDAEAAGLARHATVGQLHRGLSGLPRPTDENPPDDAKPDGQPEGKPPEGKAGARPREYVSRAWRGDGTWQLHAALNPADGALVDKAMEAAIDKLLRARYGDHADPALRANITALDALRHLAVLALQAMDPATASYPERMPSERYLLNVHLDATNPDATLLHLGPALPRWRRDELCCDTLIRTWITDTAGNVNLGRTHRTVDPKLRTVIEHRDAGCAIAGCGATRGLRIHHIVAWPAGGRTDTTNLVALCPDHHRRVHRGEYTITGNADQGLTVHDDRGRPITATPPKPIADHHNPTQAAAHLGLPPPQWSNRTGEHAHWDCVIWTEPPDRAP